MPPQYDKWEKKICLGKEPTKIVLARDNLHKIQEICQGSQSFDSFFILSVLYFSALDLALSFQSSITDLVPYLVPWKWKDASLNPSLHCVDGHFPKLFWEDTVRLKIALKFFFWMEKGKMEMQYSDFPYYKTNKTTKISWNFYKVTGLVGLRNLWRVMMSWVMFVGFINICDILQCWYVWCK